MNKVPPPPAEAPQKRYHTLFAPPPAEAPPKKQHSPERTGSQRPHQVPKLDIWAKARIQQEGAPSQAASSSEAPQQQVIYDFQHTPRKVIEPAASASKRPKFRVQSDFGPIDLSLDSTFGARSRSPAATDRRQSVPPPQPRRDVAAAECRAQSRARKGKLGTVTGPDIKIAVEQIKVLCNLREDKVPEQN